MCSNDYAAKTDGKTQVLIKINSYKDDNNFLTFDLYKLNYLYKKLLLQSITKKRYVILPILGLITGEQLTLVFFKTVK